MLSSPLSGHSQENQNLSGIINEYGEVLGINAQKCKLKITNPEGFAAGDKIIIHQSKGAEIIRTESEAYGNIDQLNNAGNFEMGTVLAVQGDSLFLTHKLLRDYDPGFGLQIVGISPLQNATISSEVTAQPWNGTTGGIVFINATGTLTLNADIEVDSLGYLGGRITRGTSQDNVDTYGISGRNSVLGAEKGESMAYPFDKDGLNYNYGRGKLVVGGGGGNNHNAGGGGGANYGAGGEGGRALQTDRRITNGNDNTGTVPGDLIGGKGGLALSALYSSPSFNKIFFGGGGGSGHQNSGNSDFKNRRHSAGKAGGGIVILSVESLVTNRKAIHANGGSYPLAADVRLDESNLSTIDNASGAGGAGGTVIIETKGIIGTLEVELNGGQGGHTYKGNALDAYGPGGGGGGGVLSLARSEFISNINASYIGGEAGTIHQGSQLFDLDNHYGAIGGTQGGFAVGITILEGTIPCNNAPEANDDFGTTGASTPISLNFLQNDHSLLPVTFEILNHFNYGNLNITDSMLTYSPVDNFIGNDTLDYQICVGTGENATCDPAKVVITVIPLEAPKLKDKSYSLTEFGPIEINLSELVDEIPPNYKLTVCEDPVSGTVNIIDNNIIQYLPNYTTTSGQDLICYQLCVNEGTTDEACSEAQIIIPFEYEITVAAQNDESQIPQNGTVLIDCIANDIIPDDGFSLSLCDEATTLGTATITADNKINYTPPTGYTGTDIICYTLCNSDNSICQSAVIQVVISGPDPAQLTDDFLTTHYNTALTADVIINDIIPEGYDAPTLCSTPINGTASFSGNNLRYTPNNGFIGRELICYQVCESGNANNCYTGNVVIDVSLDPNQIPQLYPVSIDGLPNNVDLVFYLLDPVYNFILPPNFSITIISQPAQGSTTVDNSTGTIIYNPEGSNPGLAQIVYRICNTDPEYSDTVYCTENVLAINIIPPAVDLVAEVDATVINQGDTAIIDLIANDIINGSPLASIQLITGTNNGIVTLNGSELQFIPNGDFIGTEILTYGICNENGDCDEALILIGVNPVTNVVANEDFVSTPARKVVSVNPLANDNFPNQVNISICTDYPPQHGEVQFNADGSFIYTPDDNFFGTDVFCYEICDQDIMTNCDKAFVFITVEAPIDLNAHTDEVSLPVGGTIQIPVWQNDQIMEKDISSISLCSTPSEGTAKVEGNHILYTASETISSQPILFCYQICDVFGRCANAYVVVSLVGEPEDYLLQDDVVQLPPSTTSTINVLENDELPASFSLILCSTDFPGSIRILPSLEMEYTPEENFTGEVSVCYEVCEQVRGQSIQCRTAQLRILIDDGLVANDISYNTTLNTAINIRPWENDNYFGQENGDLPAYFEIIQRPENGGLFPSSDFITYTPDTAFYGTDEFTYRICLAPDSDLCDSARVTIVIENTVNITIYNALSPNGDEMNEVFFIENLENYPNNSLLIFNRWGKECFPPKAISMIGQEQMTGAGHCLTAPIIMCSGSLVQTKNFLVSFPSNVNMKSLILLPCLLLCSLFAFGQQEPMYTQYLFNGLMYNPAYAGSRASLSGILLFRQQWTGLEGAPSTQTLSAHGQATKRMGLGVNLYNDMIGVNRTTGMNGNYSYSIPFNNKHRIRLGVSAGIIQYNNDWDKLNIKDPDDPMFGLNKESFFLPTIGMGAYYSSDVLFVGVSLPQMLQHRLDKENPQAEAKLFNHLYLTLGGIIPLGMRFKLKPSTLLKKVSDRPFQADLNLTGIIDDLIWLGFTYRTNDGIAAMIELHPTTNWWFGYAYDYPITKLNGQQNGSHEFFIGVDLYRKQETILSPRYF
nr:PorP/SprF family type IX secretion system membrane protein [Persicobacter sp. CCB-QB2]